MNSKSKLVKMETFGMNDLQLVADKRDNSKLPPIHKSKINNNIPNTHNTYNNNTYILQKTTITKKNFFTLEEDFKI